MCKQLCCFLFLLILSACGSSRNLVYFSDLKATGEYTEEIKNRTEPKIQADDLLNITVSSLNPESNLLFNNGVLQAGTSASGAVASSRANEGYLVDKDGNISFPILGKVKLGGLTKEQATDRLTADVKKHVKDGSVYIRFMNFKITVVGEVNRPSTFSVPTERINLIEALGLAGDMTVYGKRDNVLIIRERGGIRSAVRVNMNDKNILNSPYFYLQQNDILYVEPIRVKALQTGSSSFYIPLISVAVSLASILVFTFRN